MMKLLEAMAKVEGFYANSIHKNRPQKNNNPGDIMAGKFTQAHGSIGSDGRFAIFPDVLTGFKCMAALLKSSTYRGLTIEKALTKWAPPNENATKQYIATICKLTGLKSTDIISDHVELPDKVGK